MSNHPKVAVVILNWNGKFFLEKFLPSVYNSTYPNIEFVLGDNHSSDGSVVYLQQHYPNTRIIQNSENLGYAAGYNRVLSQIDADYYILLNSDVEVTAGWIEPVITMMENEPEIAVAQPKIMAYHYRHHFEHAGAAGGYIDKFGFPFCRGRIFHVTEKDRGQYDDKQEIFWASGAALFIRSDCWKSSGGFDGDFFAHMEEIDLCWRLKRAGHKIAYCPQSTVYHVGGGTLAATNPQKTYLNFRNSLYMLQKNLPLERAILIIFARLWFDLAAIFLFLVERKFRDAWAVSRSHQDFFYNFFKTAKKRKVYNQVFNAGGIYNGSIVWAFYIRSKKHFSQLNPNRFL